MNFYERSTLVKIGHDHATYGHKEFMIDTDMFVEENEAGKGKKRKEKRGGWECAILLRKLCSLRRGSSSGLAVYKLSQNEKKNRERT